MEAEIDGEVEDLYTCNWKGRLRNDSMSERVQRIGSWTAWTGQGDGPTVSTPAGTVTVP